MAKKTRSGFDNDAADKIWNDHIGNNAYVRHRDQCATCAEAFVARQAGRPTTMCATGERIFHEMLDEVDAKIEEIRRNQN
jgi:hypothetical protein